MGGSREVAAVERALQEIEAMLNADGYALKIDGYSARRLRLVIEAGAAACRECLVPPETMEGIVRAALVDELDVAEVELVYPTTGDVRS